MTEAIKQWITDESENRFPILHITQNAGKNSRKNQARFSEGLIKGIEITEGFAVWAAKNHWFRSLHNGDTWVEMKEPERELHQNRCFTTSQLLEKYLKTL